MGFYGWALLLLAATASCSSKIVAPETSGDVSAQTDIIPLEPSYFQSDASVAPKVIEKNHYIYRSVDPKDIHQTLVLFLSAQGLIARGDLQKAEGAVEVLLKAFPKVAASYVLASDLKRAQAKGAESIALMKTAVELAPADIAIKRSLSSMELQK